MVLTTLKLRHREIARLIFEGHKVTDIAKKVGMHSNTIHNITKEPLFQAYIDLLSDRTEDSIIDARKRLATMNASALDAIEESLEGNVPAHVRLKAAEGVLDRNGITIKQQVNHNHLHLNNDDIQAIKDRAMQAGATAGVITNDDDDFKDVDITCVN